MTDNRVVCSVVGTDALPYLPLAGGALGDGANLVLGTTTGTQIGTSTTQKLGFWNAPPVTRPGPYTQVYSAVEQDARGLHADRRDHGVLRDRQRPGWDALRPGRGPQ